MEILPAVHNDVGPGGARQHGAGRPMEAGRVPGCSWREPDFTAGSLGSVEDALCGRLMLAGAQSAWLLPDTLVILRVDTAVDATRGAGISECLPVYVMKDVVGPIEFVPIVSQVGQVSASSCRFSPYTDDTHLL